MTNLGEINAHLETRSRANGNVNDNADGEDNGSKNAADVHAGENNLSTHLPLTAIAVSTSGSQQNDTPLTTLGVQLCQSIAMRSEDKNTGVPYVLEFSLV